MTVTIDGSAGITYPVGTGVMKVGPTLMTAQNTTSGTAIDFTGIPAGVKRITVMLNGVSTSGTNVIQFQVGSGSYATSGYTCGYSYINGASAGGTNAFTTGFGIFNGQNTNTINGVLTLTLLSGNTWVASFSGGSNTTNSPGIFSQGSVTLSGALDRVRIATTSTDTFDAGSVNVLYE